LHRRYTEYAKKEDEHQQIMGKISMISPVPAMSQKNAAAAGGSATGGIIAGMKVLLVEDNQMNQKLVHHTISLVGGVVTIAMHGKEAVDMVVAAGDENHFDIILMVGPLHKLNPVYP
jgi:hypothetical protein